MRPLTDPRSWASNLDLSLKLDEVGDAKAGHIGCAGRFRGGRPGALRGDAVRAADRSLHQTRGVKAALIVAMMRAA